eukprot:6050949-Amphidinium_carterae.1
MSGFLQMLWITLNKWPEHVRLPLPVKDRKEFYMCLCLLPLFSFDLRSRISESDSDIITASDA